MRKPTIYDIKQDTAKNSPHFFDRGSLRFFDQTMKDFSVHKSPQGNLYILASSNSWNGSRGNFVTFRRYIPGEVIGEGRLESIDYGDTHPLDYIAAH